MRGRLRAIIRGTAGPFEVCAVVGVVLVLWWLILGWDWRTVPTPEAGRERLPQTSLDWVAFILVVMVAVGWLALRGRAVLGFVVIWVPVVVVSAWRLVAGDVLDWPVDLAALVFALSATCMSAAAGAAWARRRSARAQTAADEIADAAEARGEPAVEATSSAPNVDAETPPSDEARFSDRAPTYDGAPPLDEAPRLDQASTERPSVDDESPRASAQHGAEGTSTETSEPDVTQGPEASGAPETVGAPEPGQPPSPRTEAELGDAQPPGAGPANGNGAQTEDVSTE